MQEIQMKSVDEIQACQDKALAHLLKYLQEHSPFYKELFKSHNINIDGIKTVSDLSRIPTTTKEDISARNWDFLCVPRTEIIDYATTSGTMGKPVTIALTESDLDRLGVDGGVEHDHGFIGPHGHFPFPLVRLGRALRKTEQGVWHFPTLVGTTMLVQVAEHG